MNTFFFLKLVYSVPIRGFLIMIYILKDDGIFPIYRFKKKEPKSFQEIASLTSLQSSRCSQGAVLLCLSVEADELTLQCLIGQRGRIAGNTARKMTKGIGEKWRNQTESISHSCLNSIINII